MAAVGIKGLVIEHDVFSLTGLSLLCSLQNLQQSNTTNTVTCKQQATLPQDNSRNIHKHQVNCNMFTKQIHTLGRKT